MNIQAGDIVVSAAGHDKGQRFLVLDVLEERAVLVDGKSRRTEKPKLKNLKHLIPEGTVPAETAARMSAERPTNAWVRKVLAQTFATDTTEAKGEFACQKTM